MAYYGISKAQIEALTDSLKENNMNSADLMRFVYVLSSYHEGQEYLAQIGGFEGTERRNLAPLIAHISQDPVKFMKDAVADKENAILIALKYPDLAQKLGINSEPLTDQLKPLVMPESAKDQILAGIPAENPIVITKIGPQVISVGNVAAEFVDGLSKGDRESRIDFLTQMNEIYRADSSLIQKAVDLHYSSFLADANQNLNLGENEFFTAKTIEDLPGDSVIYKIYHSINPQTEADIFEVTDLLNKAKSGDVNSYLHLTQMVMSSRERPDYNLFLEDSLKFSHVSPKLINMLPKDSLMHIIYDDINPKTNEEMGNVITLINKAKDGDSDSYNQLMIKLSSHDRLEIDKIFDSKIDSNIYDKVLNNLPGEEILRKEEIVRRLQQEMIGLGLRPVGAPIMDPAEMADLAKDPAIFTDPRLGFIEALTPGSDLEMAVSLTGGSTETVFVQNNMPVGRFSSIFQPRTTFNADALGMLNAVEGAESENNQLSFPKMIWRNIGYAVGVNDTASGATTPAGSLIEMMTGPFGHGAMNPEAPSALHNYDAYGPGYLAKLLIAHFRGRVPDDLLAQMGPDADLIQSIHDKDPSAIDRLCNKLETWIAADVLTKKFGENKVHEVYLNHFIAGTVDGIEVKGAEGAAQVLFAKHFNELTPGEQFLIVALGQQPNEYLYDIKLDADGNLVSMEPNPAKAITQALWIIEHEKAGPKLELYLGLDKRKKSLKTYIAWICVSKMRAGRMSLKVNFIYRQKPRIFS